MGYNALTDQNGVNGEVHNTAVGYTAGANVTTVDQKYNRWF